MPDDIQDHVAFEFHGLVSDLQRNDVMKFEEDRKRQAQARAQLRADTPGQGLSAGELLKKIDGDPGDSTRAMQTELDRIEREAREAVDKSRAKLIPLPDGNFPPPPTDSE